MLWANFTRASRFLFSIVHFLFRVLSLKRSFSKHSIKCILNQMTNMSRPAVKFVGLMDVISIRDAEALLVPQFLGLE